MAKKKFLITNDDGITADGIVRLAKAAQKLGEVWVVAPESQRSAASHSITLREAFEAWEVTDFPVEGVHAYACSGMPGDCVRIGVLNIVPGGPDYVLSGINYGYNAASDLQYSATAGAAFEAAFQRVPAIAFSEDSGPEHEVTDRYLSELLEELLDAPLGLNQIWNVNFPGCSLAECGGVLYERSVSVLEFYKDTYTETELPNGHISYRVHGELQSAAEEGTDLRALLENYVSVGKVDNIGSHM